ncbi:MAG: HflK protein, partial [Acidobacteriota bacterium]|nr:HflK protein [Acidobacteriota bacterium]
NRAIPQAEGEAKQAIAQAEGYAIEVVNRARGDTDRFRAMLEEYRRAPDVTRQRILLETLAEVLPHVQQVLVVDPETRSLIPLLSLPAAAGGKKASSEEKP